MVLFSSFCAKLPFASGKIWPSICIYFASTSLEIYRLLSISFLFALNYHFPYDNLASFISSFLLSILFCFSFYFDIFVSFFSLFLLYSFSSISPSSSFFHIMSYLYSCSLSRLSYNIPSIVLRPTPFALKCTSSAKLR